MEQNLINDDLIRQLCAVHDEALSKQRQTKESTPKLSNGTEENKGYTSESQTTWFASLGMFISHRRLIVLMLCFICDGKKSRNRRYNDPFTLSETKAAYCLENHSPLISNKVKPFMNIPHVFSP